MDKCIKVGNRLIGEGQPAYIIAEMSANHAGSIERAKEIIREAKRSGADCVKIQTYTPDTITIDCDTEYFHINKGTWEGENLYQLYGKAYTPWEWQEELKEEAERVGIDFLSTPFDHTSVDFLESIGMEFYKIASFELVDIPLIRYVASKGKPIIMSTGMATLQEIEEAVQAVSDSGNQQLVLLKCSSAYPADPADMHLSTIRDLIQRFELPIGLSDHSLGSMSAVAAVTLGAKVIEKHFCLSREIENPDASFSMTPEEFKAMVEDIRRVETALGVPFYGVSEQEKSNIIFRRSIFVTKDIKKGDIFTEENIRVIRPAQGLHPREFSHVLGKVCREDVMRGMPLVAEAVEGYISFEPAKEEYMDLFFEWANDDQTRKQSFSTEPIEWETHVQWYSKVLCDDKRKLFVCRHADEAIGMLRLDFEEDSVEISYSIASMYRGRGYGKVLVKEAEKMLECRYDQVKRVIGKVKEGNMPSYSIFKDLGYKEQKQEGFYIFEKEIHK